MHLQPKKSLGQNFLKSKEAIRDIVEAGNIQPSDTIIEVGPGKGVLTRALLEKAQKVIVIEKDDRLIPLLQEEFKKELDMNLLEIRHADILEIHPDSLPKEYKIIANIPYYITGALIRKFLSTDNQPSHMVLLLQKEVAKRIVARDEKESLLSISVKVYGTPRYINTVKAKYFSPEPKVDSGIIAIENISKDFFSNIPEEKFFEIVKTGFAHKRKILLGNLKELYNLETLEKAFGEVHILKTARAEDLSLEQWDSLASKLLR